MSLPTGSDEGSAVWCTSYPRSMSASVRHPRCVVVPAPSMPSLVQYGCLSWFLLVFAVASAKQGFMATCPKGSTLNWRGEAVHYRMLFGFYGGMALLAYFVGYAFGVFDDSPSWLGTPGARDCGLGVMIALFAAFLMLLLSKRVAYGKSLCGVKPGIAST